MSKAPQEREQNIAGNGEIGDIHTSSLSLEVDITCLTTDLQVSMTGLKKDSAGKRR